MPGVIGMLLGNCWSALGMLFRVPMVSHGFGISTLAEGIAQGMEKWC